MIPGSVTYNMPMVMSFEKEIEKIVSDYDFERVTIGVLGSHSAEEVGIAAKSLGLPTVVVCQKGIDDVAQHYLAKAGIMAVRRAKESDMDKTAKATGARIATNLDDITPADLGQAGLVEERKVGEDKWVFIEGCRNPQAVTILVRGGTSKVVDEAERALHDALCVIRDIIQRPFVVTGGVGRDRSGFTAEEVGGATLGERTTGGNRLR
jgi:chaperonin GroEL (HSP60 family)